MVQELARTELTASPYIEESKGEVAKSIPKRITRIFTDMEPDDELLILAHLQYIFAAADKAALTDPSKRYKIRFYGGEGENTNIQVARIKKFLSKFTVPANVDIETLHGMPSKKKFYRHGLDLLSEEELAVAKTSKQPSEKEILDAMIADFEEDKGEESDIISAKPIRDLIKVAEPLKTKLFKNCDLLAYASFNNRTLIDDHMKEKYEGKAPGAYKKAEQKYKKLVEDYGKAFRGNREAGEEKENFEKARASLVEVLLDRERHKKPMLEQLQSYYAAYGRVRVLQNASVLERHGMPRAISSTDPLTSNYARLLKTLPGPVLDAIRECLRFWNEHTLIADMGDILRGALRSLDDPEELASKKIIEEILGLLPQEKRITDGAGMQAADLLEKLDPRFFTKKQRKIFLPTAKDLYMHVEGDQLLSYAHKFPGRFDWVEGETYYDTAHNLQNIQDPDRFKDDKDGVEQLMEELYASGKLRRYSFKAKFATRLNDFTHFMAYLEESLQKAARSPEISATAASSSSSSDGAPKEKSVFETGIPFLGNSPKRQRMKEDTADPAAVSVIEESLVA